MKKNFEFFKALSMITQFALSILTPIILCMLLAGYLKRRFMLGSGIMIIFIIIGAASGFYSMIKLIKTITNSKKDE